MTELARDITDAEFQAAVIDRSYDVPVVVDLWAPWCGPCRQLGPVLEKVARARRGDFELVKLNVDENPQVAGQLGARSIPLVVGFRDGTPVARFVGAQPQAAVMQFIDGLVPSEADRLVKAAAMSADAGNPAEAEKLLRQALESDRQHKRARLDLAELLVSQSRHDEALSALQALPSKPNDPVARLMAEIRTKMAAGDTDLPALEQRLAEDPTDLDTAIALGKALGAERLYQRALDTLLAAITQNPSYREGAARQSMIDLLAVMGPENSLTREYRQKLARAIH